MHVTNSSGIDCGVKTGGVAPISQAGELGSSEYAFMLGATKERLRSIGTIERLPGLPLDTPRVASPVWRCQPRLRLLALCETC
jgi:hypothetical protein